MESGRRPGGRGSERGQGRPLRLKLTLWFVGVFAVVQAVLGLVGAAFRGGVSTTALDSVLVELAPALAARLLSRDATSSGQLEDVRLAAANDLFDDVALRVLAPDGRVVAVAGDVGDLGDGLPEEARGGALWEPAVAEAPASSDVEGLWSPPVRVASMRYEDGDGEQWVFQIAVRPRLLQDAQRFLREYLLLAMPLSLVAAGLVGWFLVGRSLQPLRSISRAARELRAETLPQRIEVSATGTEIEDLQRQLNGALERLHAAFEAQSQFISVVSHELKTPVAVLLAEAQVLRQRAASPEDLVRFADSVEQEMRRLAGLVESFLSLARAEHMQTLPRREEVPLADVVVEAVRRASPLADPEGVRIVTRLSADGDLTVDGDQELLEILLENLLRNAIGFSPPDDPIEVGMAPASGGVELSVRDHGPGIPPEILPVIFQPFTRAPRQQNARSGTGLGLAIARRLVELHGGRISVANEQGGGCTFRVWLPLAAENGAAARRS